MLTWNFPSTTKENFFSFLKISSLFSKLNSTADYIKIHSQIFSVLAYSGERKWDTSVVNRRRVSEMNVISYMNILLYFVDIFFCLYTQLITAIKYSHNFISSLFHEQFFVNFIPEKFFAYSTSWFFYSGCNNFFVWSL